MSRAFQNSWGSNRLVFIPVCAVSQNVNFRMSANGKSGSVFARDPATEIVSRPVRPTEEEAAALLIARALRESEGASWQLD